MEVLTIFRGRFLVVSNDDDSVNNNKNYDDTKVSDDNNETNNNNDNEHDDEHDARDEQDLLLSITTSLMKASQLQSSARRQQQQQQQQKSFSHSLLLSPTHINLNGYQSWPYTDYRGKVFGLRSVWISIIFIVLLIRWYTLAIPFVIYMFVLIEL